MDPRVRVPAVLAVPLALAFALSLAGCDPTAFGGVSSPESGRDGFKDDRPGGGNDPAGGDGGSGVVEPGRYTFAISASPVDPFENEGAPATGPYDLYLWLVCGSRGLSLLEADLAVRGDAPVADHFFTPAEGVVSIDWDAYGDVNVVPADCPDGETLLGTLHLEGSGEGVAIWIDPVPDGIGAQDCGAPAESWGFSCLGFASDGSVPIERHPFQACFRSGRPFEFAISGSSTDPYVQSGDPVDGAVRLWLWNLSGSFQALGGNFEVVGGTLFDPPFSAEPPALNIDAEETPDVFLATPCAASALIGSVLVTDEGGGVEVTLVPGPDGGVAGCAAEPVVEMFACRAYSSR